MNVAIRLHIVNGQNSIWRENGAHTFFVRSILGSFRSGKPSNRGGRTYAGARLTIEDIQAGIAYGSEMARERFVEIPLEGQDAA
jgi:hypothetical protein